MSNNKTPLKGHEYDGIKEFDNPLPMWWMITFLATIIYSFLYFLHYHTDTHLLITDEYAADVEALDKLHSNNSAPITEESLKAFAADPSQIEKGHGVFSGRCVVCHGAEGGGGIGPNLCDSFWIHGKGKMSDIANSIQNGVLDKGMPAWGSMMAREEVLQVSAYVGSLKGTKPSNPKAPQGERTN